jgi:catalase (peroxidase I)
MRNVNVLLPRVHVILLVSVLKADRKRLKAEKYDLLNQMKELYATLDDKEKELRDFIRNYDKVRK